MKLFQFLAHQIQKLIIKTIIAFEKIIPLNDVNRLLRRMLIFRFNIFVPNLYFDGYSNNKLIS